MEKFLTVKAIAGMAGYNRSSIKNCIATSRTTVSLRQNSLCKRYLYIWRICYTVYLYARVSFGCIFTGN